MFLSSQRGDIGVVGYENTDSSVILHAGELSESGRPNVSDVSDGASLHHGPDADSFHTISLFKLTLKK